MNTATYMAPLVCSSVFIFGCPYTSKVPVSGPQNLPDSGITGAWKLQGSRNTFFHVETQGSMYRIERLNLSGTGRYVYKGWTTVVSNVVLLNLKDGERNPDYMLYKIEIISHDHIVVTSVSERNDTQFNTSEKLEAYLRENINEPWLFDSNDRMVFTRSVSLAPLMNN